MGYFIAITGKGGTGKTTLAAVFIRLLIQRGCKPVLAVDADPNSGLDAVLGVTVRRTLGRAREETRDLASRGMAAGVSKQRMLEMKIAECLVEADDFDLLAMGRPEGPGCYCYANNVLKDILAGMATPYPFVVLDNEAGLENLSRRIVQNVDCLVFTADPSLQAMTTVRRLYDLAKEMDIRYKKLAVIINRMTDDGDSKQMEQLQNQTGADWVIGLPENAEVASLAREEGKWRTISPDNPVLKKLDRLMTRAGIPGPDPGDPS
jgi:CO dehydrogenase maturation factor